MTERRLAAILVADVVGYSKLVGSDEAGTLAQLQSLRTDVIEPKLAKHAGRLFKAVGDGFLVEFSSAVQAVSCARAIQEANAQGALPLRIGIHVGDVVVQGDDLMGDGVNVAARIEGVAEPSGIAISQQVYDQVRDKINVGFEDKGEVALKNLARPVHVFAVSGMKTTVAPASAPALALPDKPSIAVMPFNNMSGDPEQEYFADGIVEDIVTALSRFKSLFVIARNSSFTYKGKPVDVRQVGRELGVRYVLEGSVRRAGNRLRITGQLVDSQTGAHLWADRFDGAIEDVFDLQDRITAQVTGQLPLRIEHAETERVKAKPTGNLSAYESHLRGLRAFYLSTRDSVEESLQHFYRAIELDPDFASPHAWASIAYSRRRQSQWMTDVAYECHEGVRLARRAAELRDDDSLAVGVAGFALAYFAGEVAAGIFFVDRAITLNSNDIMAWHGSGWVRCYNGDHDLAIEHLERVERLSPIDPQMDQFWIAKSLAHFCAGRDETSVMLAEKALQRRPDFPPALIRLAAGCAMAGRVDQAKLTMARALRLNPGLRHANYGAGLIMRRPEDRARLREGNLLAGMPE